MRIKTKRRSKTIYTIFDNDITWGILPEKILQFFSLIPDQEVTLTKKTYIKLGKEIEKYAWNKLLNYLSYRERSVQEVRNYLKQLQIKIAITEVLIDRAISLNYLNDNRFSELLISDLQKRSKSLTEIRNKLRLKGVDPEVISTSLNQFYDIEKENTNFIELYKKTRRRFSSLPKYEMENKILNYLTRKGFSYWKVKELLNKERG